MYISNLECTTRFWNILYHVRSMLILPLLRRFNPAEPVVEKSVIL